MRRFQPALETLPDRIAPSCLGVQTGPVLVSPMDPLAGGGSKPPVQVQVPPSNPVGSFPPTSTTVLPC